MADQIWFKRMESIYPVGAAMSDVKVMKKYLQKQKRQQYQRR